MNRHIMDTEVKITVRKQDKDTYDFKPNTEGWEYLESFFSKDQKSISFFKWHYVRPGDKFLSRVIVTIGEWDKDSNIKNRYFVKTSKFMADYDKQSLYKTHTFESTQALLEKLCAKTNTKFEKENWDEKYPEFQRYGIKPTEMELETMSKEDRAKLPKVINFH